MTDILCAGVPKTDILVPHSQSLTRVAQKGTKWNYFQNVQYMFICQKQPMTNILCGGVPYTDTY